MRNLKTLDEFEEIGVSGHELAKRLKAPHNRIYQILGGKRRVTADTARRLGRFFSSGPEIWMSLQQKYDLEVARKKEDRNFKKIKPLKRSGVNPVPQSAV